MTDGRSWCLDTSAFINPWRGYYAPDLAPGYWRTLPEMVIRGRAVVSEEVRQEIERADDGLWSWAQENISSWHPLTDEVQAVVTEIMSRWGRLVDSRKLRSRAALRNRDGKGDGGDRRDERRLRHRDQAPDSLCLRPARRAVRGYLRVRPPGQDPACLTAEPGPRAHGLTSLHFGLSLQAV